MSANQKKSTGLVPKLRFPEFREAGEWELEQIGSLGTFIGGGTPNKSVDAYWNGTIPWVSSSDILEDDVNTLMVSRYITATAVSESATKIVPMGSLLFVSRVGVGKVAIADRDVCTSQDFTNFQPKSLLNSFMAYFFSANKQVLKSFGQGTSIKGFTKEDLAKLQMPFPSRAEQQKIADCLTSLDDLIRLEAEKLDAIKAHKKGLMQQLFPAEGETLPKLRFPEFRDFGGWEVRAISSFCKVGDIDHRMPSSVADGIPYVMTGDFFGLNGIDFDNAKKVSIEDYEALGKKIKPEFGDIVIARYASVGAIRYIETRLKFLVSYSCAIVKCNEYENSKYLYHILKSDVIQSRLKFETNASSQKNIGIDSIKKLNIFLPTRPEQQRIADCLTSLDDLITAATQELETLKTHKKGLMQQLFPSAEAVEA